MQNIPNEKILRLPTVMGRTGLCRSTAYALVKDGQFPHPINLGTRSVGWLESEINAWIAARVEASRAKVVSHAR